MVRPAGVEPAAPRLGIWCSILLSYGRMNIALRHGRILLKAKDKGKPFRIRQQKKLPRGLHLPARLPRFGPSRLGKCSFCRS